jgi:hypothetical protein
LRTRLSGFLNARIFMAKDCPRIDTTASASDPTALPADGNAVTLSFLKWRVASLSQLEIGKTTDLSAQLALARLFIARICIGNLNPAQQYAALTGTTPAPTKVKSEGKEAAAAAAAPAPKVKAAHLAALQWVTELYRSDLTTYLTVKKSRLNTKYFLMAVERFPGMMWSLLEAMIDGLAIAHNAHYRTEALVCVEQLVHHRTVLSAEQLTALTQRLAPRLSKALAEHVLWAPIKAHVRAEAKAAETKAAAEADDDSEAAAGAAAAADADSDGDLPMGPIDSKEAGDDDGGSSSSAATGAAATAAGAPNSKAAKKAQKAQAKALAKALRPAPWPTAEKWASAPAVPTSVDMLTEQHQIDSAKRFREVFRALNQWHNTLVKVAPDALPVFRAAVTTPAIVKAIAYLPPQHFRLLEKGVLTTFMQWTGLTLPARPQGDEAAAGVAVAKEPKPISANRMQSKMMRKAERKLRKAERALAKPAKHKNLRAHQRAALAKATTRVEKARSAQKGPARSKGGPPQKKRKTAKAAAAAAAANGPAK